MGQPHAVQDADPAIWVHSRQPTGRLVTVSNGTIFSDPAYNYTRDFPYIWEEIAVPIGYEADRALAERILLDAAREHAVASDTVDPRQRERLRSRYGVEPDSTEPAVYWRITDAWLELTVRFLVPDRGVREVKDRISRSVLERFDAEGLVIASGTHPVVSTGPLRVSPDRAD